MKNKKHNLYYFLFIVLLTTLLWLIQRPLMNIIANLTFGTKDSFISTIDYSVLYFIGTTLLSSALAWKLKSKRAGLSLRSVVFLKVKVKRNELFAISLILIFISLMSFDIFTPTKVYSIDVLSSKPLSSIAYTDISNVNFFTTFNLYRPSKNLSKYRCWSLMSYSIQSGQNKISGFTPLEQITKLGNLVKSNNIPYVVYYANKCKNYSVPPNEKSLIESALGVNINL